MPSIIPLITRAHLIILLLLQLHKNSCHSFFIRSSGSTSAQIKYLHPLRRHKYLYVSQSLSLRYTLLTKDDTHTNISINTTTPDGLQATMQAIHSISLSLNKDQVMQLPAKDRYQYRIRQLLQYNSTYGTFDLPYNYPHDTQLAKWAQSQRYEYSLYKHEKIGVKSSLSKERIQLLDYVGFPWSRSSTGEKGLTKRWMAKYSMLKEYKRSYGHVRVPESYVCADQNVSDEEQAPVNLGLWVKNQRRNARIRPNDSKTILRIEKLNEVGFIWDTKDEGNTIYDANWTNRYQELKQFGEEWGHLHVPMNESRELVLWQRSQRSLYRQYNAHTSNSLHLSKDCTVKENERIELLNSINFDWNGRTSMEQRRNETWWNRFEELQVFRDTFGHLDIGAVIRGYGKSECNNSNAANYSDICVDMDKLYRWTNTQRVRYKGWNQSNEIKTHLTRDRIEAMTELGFVWDKREDQWQIKYQQLKAFGEEHGHYNVPTAIPSLDSALTYIHQQDDAISNQEDFWNQMTELGRWARGQRVLFRKYKRGDDVSTRSRDLMQQLDNLGFLDIRTNSDESISAAIGSSPEEKEIIWDRYFAKLNDTQNKQGHCFIPYAREEHDMEQKRLHEWVAIQRRRFRIILKKMNQGQSVAAIDLERFDKLKKLGFIFNVHEYKFQCNLNELKEFHSRFGHSKVSPSHHGDRHLYNFVVRQRHLYRERILKGMNNSLCDERMEKLSKLDFVWRTSSRMN